MSLSPAEKSAYCICLVLTILLVGLHFSVAGTGNQFYKSDDPRYMTVIGGENYSKKDFNLFAAFLIVTAGLTFIISIVLLIAYCGNKLTPRSRHLLATLNLILEFAIAVTVSIAASVTSDLRDKLYNSLALPDNSDLNIYYRLLIADAVITFVLQVVYLVVIYFGTIREIQSQVILTPTLQDPPITADRLQ